MSSMLQLDVRNLSLGMRHLVNAYEVKAGIGVIAGDPCLSALRVLQKWALYKYTYLYLLPFIIACQHTDARYWYSKSVCLSLCPLRSGIRWKRLNILSVFSPYGSPIILVFYQHQTFSQNSDGVTHCGDAKYRWGIKISRFSTNKSLYLANDTRYRHCFYGRRIGTRMRSIKWCHFQWPWTNPNPAFKVTSLLDAKYLTNGYRYVHSYYRRRIGNRTQAFEWHQFQWPRVTSNPDFKVPILFNVK